MIIVDAAWTPKVNWLYIRCHCGEKFGHRADRWNVVCPRCNHREHLGVTRQRFVDRGGFKGEVDGRVSIRSDVGATDEATKWRQF